jgi:hypothetical protein
MEKRYIFIHREHPDWPLCAEGTSFRYTPHGIPWIFYSLESALRVQSKFNFISELGILKEIES